MAITHPLFNTPLPAGWQLVTVNDIISPEKSACVAGPFGSNISSKYFVDSGVPIIRGGNLRTDLTRFVPEGFAFVSEEQATKYKAQHVRSGDLVFTCWGTVGQVGLIPGIGPFPEYIISNKQLKLRPNLKLTDPEYLFFYFAGPKMVQHILGKAIGAAVPGINLGILKGLPVVLPPLSVQHRIAGILSAYDELIENSQRRIKILESMARALYREWFVRFRFPSHENHRRVASPLGEIPHGWEVKSLADVCSRITDGSHFSPPSVEDGYPMASVKDMHDWGINLESCRRITGADYENLLRNDCKPMKNDVLIAKDGSYLKHTFVVGEEQELVILSSIAMLRPNHAIRPNYLCFVLRDPVTKARLKGIVSGVAVPRIVLKDFRKFQILLPPPDVQIDWAKKVDPILEMCRKLVSQIQNLRRTRDLLLPRLLSGQIDVEAA